MARTVHPVFNNQPWTGSTWRECEWVGGTQQQPLSSPVPTDIRINGELPQSGIHSWWNTKVLKFVELEIGKNDIKSVLPWVLCCESGCCGWVKRSIKSQNWGVLSMWVKSLGSRQQSVSFHVFSPKTLVFCTRLCSHLFNSPFWFHATYFYHSHVLFNPAFLLKCPSFPKYGFLNS